MTAEYLNPVVKPEAVYISMNTLGTATACYGSAPLTEKQEEDIIEHARICEEVDIDTKIKSLILAALNHNFNSRK